MTHSALVALLRRSVTAVSHVYFLVGVWLLVMVLVPISRWTAGEEAMRGLIVVSVAVQATAVFEILRAAWGWQRTGRLFLAIAAATFLVEFVGSRTGKPFGPYHYTPLLQPQLGGVPLVVPLAWFMMLPPAWAVADRFRGSRWRFALVSAAAFTAWDLLLDPQMVRWGFWEWTPPGGYFGIPWSNYGGWLLTAVALTFILRPKDVPIRPLLLIYTITCFLEIIGLALFWGMPGPALTGGAVMCAFTVLGWRQPTPGGYQPLILLRRSPAKST